VQNVQCLLTAPIAGVGLQEPLELRPASHDRPTASTSSVPRYPLAASAARSLGRASNIVL
jgi:predicted small lipoprotein YifL